MNARERGMTSNTYREQRRNVNTRVYLIFNGDGRAQNDIAILYYRVEYLMWLNARTHTHTQSHLGEFDDIPENYPFCVVKKNLLVRSQAYNKEIK